MKSVPLMKLICIWDHIDATNAIRKLALLDIINKVWLEVGPGSPSFIWFSVKKKLSCSEAFDLGRHIGGDMPPKLRTISPKLENLLTPPDHLGNVVTIDSVIWVNGSNSYSQIR